MRTSSSILSVILWCTLLYSTSPVGTTTTSTRHNRDLEAALLGLFEPNDLQIDDSQNVDNGRIFAQKREEKRVLKELYYLAKVLKAYRLPHAYGSKVFKSVIDRVTNKELLDQLERKLRHENGIEVIARIGTNGTEPDPLQLQLANDFRLLAPVLVRTLRRVVSLKKVPEILQVDEKSNFLYELQWDVQNEWQMLREAVRSLQGDGVVPVKPLDLYPSKAPVVYKEPINVVPEHSSVEYTDSGADGNDWATNPIAGGYHWGDARGSATSPQDVENLSWEIEERRSSVRQPEPQTPVVIIQQSTTKISEAPAPVPVKPLPSKVRPFPVLVSSPPASSLATQLSAEVDRVTRELIAVELDKFLLRVEDLSGVDGFSKEFDRSDRARMVGWVKQFYSPSVGLDQREFLRALRRLLKTKQLRRGRPDVLEALDYLQSQLDIDRRDLGDEIFLDERRCFFSNSFQVVGGPCGYHGSYTFFKGLKITFGTKGTLETGSSSASSASSVACLPVSSAAPRSGSVGDPSPPSTANTTSTDNSSTSNGHDRRRPSVDIPSEVGGTSTTDSPDPSSTPATTIKRPSTGGEDGEADTPKEDQDERIKDRNGGHNTAQCNQTNANSSSASSASTGGTSSGNSSTSNSNSNSDSNGNNGSSSANGGSSGKSQNGNHAKPKQTQRKCVSENGVAGTGGGNGGSVGGSVANNNGTSTRAGINNNLCRLTSVDREQHYRPLVLALGDCIPVRPWSDSPIACLAELRMVWRDRNEQCLLIALRLYFLPENTPMGRNCHGEVSFRKEAFCVGPRSFGVG
uniref:Uncharacterized protein n=1 Tax=Anopheles maculatus TaxID=74869 RepID=A0A182SD67_9DIPT